MTVTKTTPLPVLAPFYACPPDCGLCCKHLIVEASPLDVIREPRIAEYCAILNGRGELTPGQASWGMYSKDRINPPQTPLRCAFLNNANRCVIYATRPNVCVAFMSGSEKCQELRRDHGLPPLKPREAVTMPEKIAAEFAPLGEDEFE